MICKYKGNRFCEVEVSVEGEGMTGEKGVEHCIFKEHAVGQGMIPSLGRFAVRIRIKQAGGKFGCLLPELRRLEAPVAGCNEFCPWHW